MIERLRETAAVVAMIRRSPVVAVLGARQVGKSTLARQILAQWPGPATLFDLEDDRHLARLEEPGPALRPLRGLVVIDEVQRVPEVFPALRPLADRRPLPARFLLLGSAAPSLVSGGSESLAGRIAFHELEGLGIDEVGVAKWRRLWLRGSYPRAFLARSDALSMTWRREFLRIYLERDIAEFHLALSPVALRRFWAMLAHWHGQRWNASEFARAFGVSESTVRRWLESLVGLYAVRLLQPWHESLGKRQVKSPKVYLNDTGMLHAVFDLPTLSSLEAHPRVGASFEGLAIAQVARVLQASPEQCFHWATQSGAELDLLVVQGGRRLGFEIKRTDAPKLTMSMRIATEDLRLDRLFVVHAGSDGFDLADRVTALPIERLSEVVKT